MRERELPVPSWDDVRIALFGSGGRRGLVERCSDEATLVTAAWLRHPYLAAYCAHVGRDRLALAPIHEEDEGDRGRSQLEELRDAHESLAPVWRERWSRRLPVTPAARGRSNLRRLDFAHARSAAGIPTPATAGVGQHETSASSRGADAGTRDRGSS